MRLPVKGFEGHYEVDSSGYVFSLKRNRKMVPNIVQSNNKGYCRVQLHREGVGKKIMVHRLVGEAFVANPNNLPFINHKDKNTRNNSADNLEWCTAQHNAEHALSKDFVFVSPSGEITSVFNLTKFCRENGLTQSLMDKVHKKQRNQHKGWKSIESIGNQ